MMNNELVQLKKMMQDAQLTAMRKRLVEYSADYDAREECKRFESAIRQLNKQKRGGDWAKNVYKICETTLSQAAKKYFTLADMLASMRKEADKVNADIRTAYDNSCRKKAEDLDGEIATLLSIDLSLEFCDFVKYLYDKAKALSKDVLAYSKSMGKLTETFGKLDKLRHAATFDSNVRGLASIVEPEKRIKECSRLLLEYNNNLSAEEKGYCLCYSDLLRMQEGTKDTINKNDESSLISSLNYLMTDRPLLKDESWCFEVEKKNELVNQKRASIAKHFPDFAKKWQTMLDAIPQIRKKFNDERLHAARELDDTFVKYSNVSDSATINLALAFIEKYLRTDSKIVSLCKRATPDEIGKLKTRLCDKKDQNDRIAKAQELDGKLSAFIKLKREAKFLADAKNTIKAISGNSPDVLTYCKVATKVRMADMLSEIESEEKLLDFEMKIDALAVGCEHTIKWRDKVYELTAAIGHNLSNCRNGAKLTQLKREADKIYAKIVSAPYIDGLKPSANFATVFELNSNITAAIRPILEGEISFFEKKWKDRLALAEKDKTAFAVSRAADAENAYNKGNYAQAFKYATESFNLGCNKATFILGSMYFDGKGIAADVNKAVEFLKLAGTVAAECILADIYEKSSPKDCFAIRKKLVDGGNKSERIKLAKMYYNGDGTPKDYEKAKNLFTELSKEGDLEATYYLGCMYEEGFFFEKNEESAFDLYQKALAYAPAKKAYDRLESKISAFKLDREIDVQFELAKKGNPEAQFYIGECFYLGRGVEQSYKYAKEWFEKAAARKNGKAMSRLGDMYYYGNGVKTDLRLAEKYYKKAIKHGER